MNEKAMNQAQAMVRPDIFICGVMKSGTTILHDYICTHPDIVSGSQKEIHYFSLHYDKGPDWYNEHFKAVEPGKRTIDASPTYFDAANTAQIPRLINAYCSDPKIIVITRDPVERAISQFIHLKVTTGDEPLKNVDIDEFFNRPVIDAWRQTSILGYYQNLIMGFSLYTRKHQIYRDNFKEHQLLFLDNASLRSNPREEMQKVFEYLGVDYVDNEVFGKVKYSNGSSLRKIKKETFEHLSGVFYPDYRRFCELAGLEFRELSYPDSALDECA